MSPFKKKNKAKSEGNNISQSKIRIPPGHTFWFGWWSWYFRRGVCLIQMGFKISMDENYWWTQHCDGLGWRVCRGLYRWPVLLLDGRLCRVYDCIGSTTLLRAPPVLFRGWSSFFRSLCPARQNFLLRIDDCHESAVEWILELLHRSVSYLIPTELFQALFYTLRFRFRAPLCAWPKGHYHQVSAATLPRCEHNGNAFQSGNFCPDPNTWSFSRKTAFEGEAKAVVQHAHQRDDALVWQILSNFVHFFHAQVYFDCVHVLD